MKEPKRIPLNNIKNKEPKRIPLITNSQYDIDMYDDIWTQNENNQQNNTTSISELESDKID